MCTSSRNIQNTSLWEIESTIPIVSELAGLDSIVIGMNVSDVVMLCATPTGKDRESERKRERGRQAERDKESKVKRERKSAREREK